MSIGGGCLWAVAFKATSFSPNAIENCLKNSDDDTGNSPFSFNTTVGTNTISQTNVYANPCFLPVSPLVNSFFSISGFADANCSGSFSGSALANVTTLTSTFLGNNLENGFY